MKSEKIVIVGGGSAGWMTAATLIKHYPNKSIIVVEDPGTPTVGVGESTLGHFNDFLRSLDLRDEDWMPYCNASYKTSIKFTDWKSENSGSFHYPFGGYDFKRSTYGVMDWFLLKVKHGDKWDNNHFAKSYTSIVELTDKNKYHDNKDGSIPNFNPDWDVAYHLDAALFGEFLKDKFCLPKGVTYISGKYISPNLDEHGFVESINTENGAEISGDLFIDCTGMRSLLLEGIYDVPFISFGDTLLNDRAIATQIPYIDKEKELEPVTNSTAIESGWCWNIPLWSRIGSGYVYSSKFATEEQAEEEFKKYLSSDKMTCGDTKEGKERVDNLEFKHIKIRHGFHEKSWVNNVCAIGMSIGFIEPLESTGLLLWHEAIKMLTDTLDRETTTRYDRDCFNTSMRSTLEGFYSFICYHYSCSMRKDTPYWFHATQKVDYFSGTDNILTGRFGPTDNIGNIALARLNDHDFPTDLAGMNYISAGMGISPVTAHSLKRRNLGSKPSTTLNRESISENATSNIQSNQPSFHKGVTTWEGDDLPTNVVEWVKTELMETSNKDTDIDIITFNQELTNTEKWFEEKLKMQEELSNDPNIPSLTKYLYDNFYKDKNILFDGTIE